MRVLLISRFWAEDRVPPARMLVDVAKALRARGHAVTVLTSADAYAPGQDRMDDDGVEVVRVRSFGPRAARWLILWAAAVVGAPLMRWDRCVMVTDPPLMNWLAVLDRLARGARRKRIWWVMDLYPDAVAASGLIARAGPLDRVLRRVTDRSLRALDGVIALDEAQRRRLRGYSGFRREAGYSIVVPPWDHRELSAPRANRFVARAGLQGRKVVLYAGNLGRAHVFEPLLEAARNTPSPDWSFVFVCRGHGRPALERAAAGLTNVRVLDYGSPEEAADMLYSASVHVITLRESWTGISVPSKLYGVLRTGRPVLFLGSRSCGTARAIEALGAGRVLPTNAPAEWILGALAELASRPTRTSVALDRSGPERVADFVERG